jgi:purine-binding chemotaxis protein CheW
VSEASGLMAEPARASRSQYLSFELAGEYYGVDILKVQEIRGWQPVRELPDTPAFIKGVMDLRGIILPIIDLRLRFGLEPAIYGPATVIIILTVVGPSGVQTVGIVVDTVSDVMDVEETMIKPIPELGSHIHIGYILGMVAEQNMVMLLDTDRLLAADELSAFHHYSSDTP